MFATGISASPMPRTWHRLKIKAISREGFPDDVRRTVTENPRTPKFEAQEFET